ncbi:hypothetical protein [Streptomyces sp. P17]|uniref:hypothetical protein n=1 Tax=Streptomyces sp. P17 TaxID=3074716 RepID=UPI0028F4089A|nr:hypothetical protein [Streptomyces sp. P17]MDT9698002.1 hypothetical protein [Streptomyces sp. P17]
MRTRPAKAAEPTPDHARPHLVINGRHASRELINCAVPDALQLQRRIRQYHADYGVQHGDIVAIGLDAFLRAKGYPPDHTSPKAEEQ